MGNAGSIFYPSNPDRRRRAEQLKNDCEIAEGEYFRTRDSIEKFLDPLQGKLDDVLKALGCHTLAEFDRLVQNTAVGAALSDWNRIKNQYVITDKIEASIWATCGIIAMAGFTISSTMGLFSFGIGFVAGIGITAVVLAVIGGLGLIFDAIFGAIERSRLREAIEDLCLSRLRIRQLVNQMKEMERALPAINTLWDSIISMGGNVDREIIIQMIADDKEGILGKPWTYTRTAQGLVELDRSRSSWRDEDPDFVSTAAIYDMLHDLGLMSSFSTITSTSSTQLKGILYASGVAHEETTSGISGQAAQEISEFCNKNPDVVKAATSAPTHEDSPLRLVMSPSNGQKTSGRIFNDTVLLTLAEVQSATNGIVDVDINGQKEQYIAEMVDYNDTGSVHTSFANVLLFSISMPTRCLQPDGTFSTDRERGKILVKFA